MVTSEILAVLETPPAVKWCLFSCQTNIKAVRHDNFGYNGGQSCLGELFMQWTNLLAPRRQEEGEGTQLCSEINGREHAYD